MTAKGMVMIQNKVVNTFKRPEYAASLLYTWAIWVIVEADGVMEARNTMRSKVLPSGIRAYTWLTYIISSKTAGQMTSLMAEKMYSFAFFRLSRIGESAISMPVTIMLRGASIFPMSFTGVSMTDGSFIWQKKSRSPAIMAITFILVIIFFHSICGFSASMVLQCVQRNISCTDINAHEYST